MCAYKHYMCAYKHYMCAYRYYMFAYRYRPYQAHGTLLLVMPSLAVSLARGHLRAEHVIGTHCPSCSAVGGIHCDSPVRLFHLHTAAPEDVSSVPVLCAPTGQTCEGIEVGRGAALAIPFARFPKP